jgi:hypothetical protein
LAAGKIVAFSVDEGNVVSEIHAALWRNRTFNDLGPDVIAVVSGHKPLRNILLKRDDILRIWPAETMQTTQLAIEATPHIDDQEALIPAPDASPAKRTRRPCDQALVEAEIMKLFPGGVPPHMPPKK